MTHAAFHAPVIHAAASAMHKRLIARAEKDGIGTVPAAALHGSEELTRFAAAVGEGVMFLDLADFTMIANDMPQPGAKG